MRARASVISSRKKPSTAVKQFSEALEDVEPILTKAEEAAQERLEQIEWVRSVTYYWKTVGVGFQGDHLVFVRKDGRAELPEIEPCTLPEACEMLERIIRSEMLFGGDIEVSDEGSIKFLHLVRKSVS